LQRLETFLVTKHVTIWFEDRLNVVQITSTLSLTPKKSAVFTS